ncbi:MAG TPA: Ig-like domain-containing protein [Gemmatimonadales bacterium]|nr:Ig-like domain-containing protein [Gemmatimonadales bacterium]
MTEVQVAPPSMTLRAGERSGLLATAFDRAGNVLTTVKVLWSSNNIQVARVDNNGNVTGVGNGVAIIEARVGTRKGTAAVQVVGGAAPVSASAAPQGGQPQGAASEMSLAGQPPGAGPATQLRIEPPTIYLLPSENVRASPRALKDDGSPAAPIGVTWKSLRPDIASVDANGVVIALAAGQGTIQVTSASGLTATAPILVQQADFAIQEQGPIIISPGQSDTLHVAVPTQAGRVINPIVLQWVSSDPSIARVTMTGIVAAVNPGKATLTVSGLLETKSVEVVVHRPVELLAVRPRWQDTVLLPVLGVAKFEAQALAADRTPVPEAPLRWSVVDSSIATFDAVTGQLTARAPGRTQLVARGPGPGLAVTWTVRVIAAAVKLSTSRIGLPLNRRYPVRATYMDEAGATVGPASNLVWTSDNPQVATAAEDGTITSTGYGHAVLTATAPGGMRATLEVFVQGEVAFVSSRSGRFQLYAVERSSLTQLRRVGDDSTEVTEPAFSPDGSRIAFSSTRAGGRPALYVMDADGTGAVRVTKGAGSDAHPQFTPDGASLVFQSDRTGHGQIWAQRISGGEATQLTQEPAANLLPTVSFDGETIAFVSTRDGGSNIWLMAKDGSNQRAFTRLTGGSKATSPHFLRDGGLTYLVSAKENGRPITQVVKADLASGRSTPLTGADLTIADFGVSPAGDLLALVASVQVNNKPFFRVYVQPTAPGSTAVALPSTGPEYMVTPTFMP